MEITEKWKALIEAAKNYYIDSIPTGYTDSEYDEMEKRALEEDNFSARDYVFEKYLKGVKTENQYIEKIKKEKVTGLMYDALVEKAKDLYITNKHDGCSLAIYLDPTTGIPLRLVTVGNLNLSSYGIDQSWKLISFMPQKFPKGIVAIQSEILIDITRMPEDLDPEKARQKTSGLTNSIYCEEEVKQLLTIRAYRYYCNDSLDGVAISKMDYKDVLNSFQTVYSKEDGHVLFAPADVYTLEDVIKNPNEWEVDRVNTTTGTFLRDGLVLYSRDGVCLEALKYAGAGSTSETLIKTKVKSIIWNNQNSKGKDSWSANVEIDPIKLKGVVIKKPSAGSVKKLIEKKISPGAEVSIILANSTIPMIGECFAEGDGNFSWPTCSCGYQMSSNDVYGSLLKCGNPMCTERIDRMKKTLSKYSDIHKDLNLNEYLVIDRFKWETTCISIDLLLDYVEKGNKKDYYTYLKSFMKTPLQIKNLDLVWEASYEVLRECFEFLKTC